MYGNTPILWTLQHSSHNVLPNENDLEGYSVKFIINTYPNKADVSDPLLFGKHSVLNLQE